MGAAHGAVGSVLTKLVFSQAEPDEAEGEPEEASRKTLNSSSWTGQGRMKLWALRTAQWAACSQRLCFHRRSRTKPERRRRKPRGKHSARQAGPGMGRMKLWAPRMAQ